MDGWELGWEGILFGRFLVGERELLKYVEISSVVAVRAKEERGEGKTHLQ